MPKTNDFDTSNDAHQPGVHSVYASDFERTTQFQKYHNSRTGHGFAAEDANALNDVFNLKNVEKTGSTNTLNGPDRLVSGVSIQTKYYQTAQATVDSAFESQNGFYRYPGQCLEVPNDQHDEAIEIMEEKIRLGKVFDASNSQITDSNEASNIIKKGSITYKQAKNIAKAGNIDSIYFDVKNNVISTTSICGLSFAVFFAHHMWSGKNTMESLKHAFANALNAGSTSFISGIVASQVLRTKMAAAGTIAMRDGVKAVSQTSLGKQAIEQIAKASLGKAVYGASAVNHVSKLLRSNVITSCAMTAVVTAPDFYRVLFSNSISWAQFSKNLAVNISGVAGGIGGWAGGAAAGAALGTVVPIVGNAIGAVAGGLIGAFGGGFLASKGAKAVADRFVEDDAKEMLRLMQYELSDLASEFLLSESEVNALSIKVKETVDVSWLRDMYASSSRYSYVNKEFYPVCERIIARRKQISLPCNSILEENILRMSLKVIQESRHDSNEYAENYSANHIKSYNNTQNNSQEEWAAIGWL